MERLDERIGVNRRPSRGRILDNDWKRDEEVALYATECRGLFTHDVVIQIGRSECENTVWDSSKSALGY